MPKLTIIGGGIQGSALAMRLLHRGFSDFVIVDKEPPLSRWLRTTPCLVGSMLRSPWDANIDPRDVIPQDRRPQTADLKGFNAHVEALRTEYGLKKFWKPGSVQQYAWQDQPGGHSVVTETQIINSNNVVVACGLGKPWSPFAHSHARIIHADTCDFGRIRKGDKVAVIGGSITGLTVATELKRRGVDVVVIHRGEIHVSQLEVDRSWRPDPSAERFQFFMRQKALKRAKLLRECRQFGTVTQDVLEQARKAKLTIHETTPVEYWEEKRGGKIRLRNADDTKIGAYDYIVCATGYKAGISLTPFLAQMSPNIKTVDDLPVLTDGLESTISGLFFLGRLAELGLGPLGRNIIGAKFGSMKITDELINARAVLD